MMYHSKEVAQVVPSQDVKPHVEGLHDDLQDVGDQMTPTTEPTPDIIEVDEVHRPDEWQHVPVKRLDFQQPLSPEAKQSLRQGSFEVVPAMFKRILQHMEVQP